MIKNLLVILGLLVCLNVGAATKYFDSTCATPGDGTTSTCSGATAPYDQFSDYTIGANDTINCTGTFNEQITLINISGVTIQAYGSGCVIDGQNTRSYGISADRTSSLTVSGLEIKNATRNGIYLYSNTASTTVTNQTISNNLIHDIGPGTASPATESDLEIGTCLLARSGPTTGTAQLTGVTVSNNTIYNCGKHGIDFRYRVYNVSVTDNDVTQAGLTATGHGISFHPFNQNSWSPAWTLASGTIYYHDLLSTNDTHQRMWVVTTGAYLTKVASTTTPASGEWSVTSVGVGACSLAGTQGCLYVNTGANVTTQTLALKRHSHGPFYVSGNHVYNNVSGVDSAEGQSIDADDGTGPITIEGNYVHEADNAGLQCFFCENAKFIGNISVNNDGSGIYIRACSTCEISNNTLSNNGDLGFYDGGVKSERLTFYNNLLTYNFTRSGSVTAGTAGASGFGSDNNVAFGNITNNSCTNLTCSLISDPKYQGGASPTTLIGFNLKSDSPYKYAGKNRNIGGYLDARGRAFLSVPSIGGIEITSGDNITNRTTASTRTNRN